MTAKPRILVSYFFGPDTIPLGESVARAFEQLGYDVYRFHSQVSSPWERYLFKWLSKLIRGLGFKKVDLSRDAPWGNTRYRQSTLEQAVRDFRPDVLLVIRGNSFEAETLQNMKSRYGVKTTIGWWVKDPRPESQEMLQDAKSYDHYFCIHQHGYTVKDGIHFLPALSIDRELYRPTAPIQNRSYSHDIVFVGGWNPRRQQIMERLTDLPIEIYGPGWRKRKNWFNPALRRCVRRRGIWGDDLIKLYNSSKIVLNITGWNAEKLSGLNLRIFDVPACGAFLITDYADELRTYFDLDAEIETYRSAEELADKLRYYLGNAEALTARAEAAYRRTLDLPSVEDRVREILDVIQNPCDAATSASRSIQAPIHP